MHFEVEQKHRLADTERFEAELAARRVKLGGALRHVDTYYNHPCRNFAQTDEALRIRQIGELNFVTYKGPKIDQSTKTRRELEVRIAKGQAAAAHFGELLEALGFVKVAEVVKLRRSFTIAVGNWVVTGTIDQVEPLGSFVELEVTAEEAELDNARQAVATLAEQLQLGPGERRSYLEMILTSPKSDSSQGDP
jgi:adenylate cyclase class 2